MLSKQRRIWECPICGNCHSSDWRLSSHIGGMAVTYNDRHSEWATARVPDVDIESLGTAASMLRPFVLAEVSPRILGEESLEPSIQEILSDIRSSIPTLSGSQHLAPLLDNFISRPNSSREYPFRTF